MNPTQRIEKLEAQAAPQGHCPHLPPILRYFAPDGSETTYSEPQGQSDSERALTCNCGRERLTIEVRETENLTPPTAVQFIPYRAEDLSDDELAAILARGD
jgi:hypothetical protein